MGLVKTITQGGQVHIHQPSMLKQIVPLVFSRKSFFVIDKFVLLLQEKVVERYQCLSISNFTFPETSA